MVLGVKIFAIVFYAIIGVLFVASCVLLVMWLKLKDKRDENFAAFGERVKEVDKPELYMNVKSGTVTVIDKITADTKVVAAPQVNEVAADSAAGGVVLADNSVVFAANSGEKQTFDEKLAALSKAEIKLYNELVSYITGKDDTKENKSTSKTQFKYSKERMMTASVKRGVMVLEFMLYNSDLERNARLNDDLKSAKIAPVVIKLRTESDLAAAKQTVDMTMAYIAQERDYRKEQQKALRREKAAAAKQAK